VRQRRMSLACPGTAWLFRRRVWSLSLISFKLRVEYPVLPGACFRHRRGCKSRAIRPTAVGASRADGGCDARSVNAKAVSAICMPQIAWSAETLAITAIATISPIVIANLGALDAKGTASCRRRPPQTRGSNLRRSPAWKSHDKTCCTPTCRLRAKVPAIPGFMTEGIAFNNRAMADCGTVKRAWWRATVLLKSCGTGNANGTVPRRAASSPLRRGNIWEISACPRRHGF
jgi:hypothetical protein